MDKRSLPISMRPHLCRVKPQSQQALEHEQPVFIDSKPESKPTTKKGKGKKADIIAVAEPKPTIREEIISVMGKRNG